MINVREEPTPRQLFPGENSKQRRREDDKIANGLQPHRQPPVADHLQEGIRLTIYQSTKTKK